MSVGITSIVMFFTLSLALIPLQAYKDESSLDCNVEETRSLRCETVHMSGF